MHMHQSGSPMQKEASTVSLIFTECTKKLLHIPGMSIDMISLNSSWQFAHDVINVAIAHKLIRIYMGGLILGINTLYMLSCFLKQFALVGKGLMQGPKFRVGWTS